MPLVCRVLGTPAWTHYFVLLITRAVSEGLIGLIGHMLGGFPPLPLYCPPHPVQEKATQDDAEDPYAAFLRVLAPRVSRMRACRSAKLVYVTALVLPTLRPRLVGRMPAVMRRRILVTRCRGDLLQMGTGCCERAPTEMTLVLSLTRFPSCLRPGTAFAEGLHVA